MAKVLAWCVQTTAFQFHPAMHMPVGLAALYQVRERVTRVYAFIDAGAKKSGERKNMKDLARARMAQCAQAGTDCFTGAMV